jgi:hypothetical protein
MLGQYSCAVGPVVLRMVTSYTLYGYIHILLIVAIVVLLIRLIQGRSPI